MAASLGVHQNLILRNGLNRIASQKAALCLGKGKMGMGSDSLKSIISVGVLETVRDLQKLIEKGEKIVLYGAGKVCDKILCYLEWEKRIDNVEAVYVTKKSENKEELHGIKIECYNEDVCINNALFVVAVASAIAQKEIVELLANYGRKACSVLGKEFEKDLDTELINIKCRNIKKRIQEYVEQSDESDEVQDIRLFSMPYWDAYSPFSAVPCLVARLRQEGYKVGQSDLGIKCFHWLLRYRWKEAACICLSNSFYEENFVNYRKNSYESYKDFLNDMWFLRGEHFDVTLVKKKYMEMNPVQKRVIDAFYEEIYKLDLSNFDFDQCKSLTEEVNKYIQADFLEELASEDIISIFRNMPRIIGVSVISTNQFLPACLFARIVKDMRPGAVIIMGGSCANLFMKCQYKAKEEIYQYFDYVIVGEGETSLSMLMECLVRNKGNSADIPQLLHIDNGFNLTVNNPIVEDVGTLPIPDYEGLDLSLYLAPEVILPYQSSRGCHYGQCAFCNHDEKYRHNYRTKDMKKVVQELIFLSHKYNTKYFQFVDEAIRPDCFRKMVEEMDACEDFHNILWFFYSRVSMRYDNELLEKAYKNGCRMVMFGVETFNQRLLNFIKKGINSEVSKRCLRLFHDCGIKTFAWLMCNLPSETIQEAREDLENVKKMEEYIDAFCIGLFFLSKDTDMYREPEKYNITYIDEENPFRFISHYKGEEIDKDEMLRFFENEYEKYQKELCSNGNRYTIFWESVASEKRNI